MARLICLLMMLALVVGAFRSSDAQAAQTHRKPPRLWHGYGFLPGYHQPPSNSQPIFDRPPPKRGVRLAQRKPPPWYIDPVPYYWGYDGNWHFFGRPGFYRGRYNGGSFGPCWTRTPAGPIWNCG